MGLCSDRNVAPLSVRAAVSLTLRKHLRGELMTKKKRLAYRVHTTLYKRKTDRKRVTQKQERVLRYGEAICAILIIPRRSF